MSEPRTLHYRIFRDGGDQFVIERPRKRLSNRSV